MPEPSSPESGAAPWFKRHFNWLALAFAALFFIYPHFGSYGPLDDYVTAPRRFGSWTLAKLEHLFKDYGYYVVFLGVFLENAMFLGLLVPGSIILILGGLAGQNGSINLALVIPVAIAATMLGDTLSYFVGRMGWSRMLERGSLRGVIAHARESMATNHRWIILAYHFAGYSRVVGPTAAGLFRIPYRSWAPLDYAGGTVWVLLYVSIGVVLGMFGVEFGDTKKMMNLVEIMFTVLVIAAIVIAWYRSSKAPAEAPSPAPAVVIIPVDES
jgi:membrane protein DedA with SNARE-associated domain